MSNFIFLKEIDESVATLIHIHDLIVIDVDIVVVASGCFFSPDFLEGFGSGGVVAIAVVDDGIVGLVLRPVPGVLAHEACGPKEGLEGVGLDFRVHESSVEDYTSDGEAQCSV